MALRCYACMPSTEWKGTINTVRYNLPLLTIFSLTIFNIFGFFFFISFPCFFIGSLLFVYFPYVPVLYP